MSDTEVSVARALLERLLDRVEELEAELKEYRVENERDKATIRKEVSKAVEAEPSEAEPETSDSHEMLPIERLARFGEDHAVVADVTASVKRATAIFEHFRGWASKTPRGYVVKDNLKSLLETATGEQLAWKQVYRACRKLEQWSKEQFRFEKHRRHGWMIVAESLGRMSSADGG